MNREITFYQSDLVDALYYFEYHSVLYKKISWIERDKRIRELYNLIREIKFPNLKRFLPWARFIAVIHKIETPAKLVKYIHNNPPKGKFAQKWLEEIDKMEDIIKEILKLFKRDILTPEIEKEFMKTKDEIIKKYTNYFPQFITETDNMPGFVWKRKEPIICLIYPIVGNLSHKSSYGDIAFIEVSKDMLAQEDLLLHEVVKLLNFTKPIGSWVKQDKRGIRAIAYELFTELQTQKIIQAITGKKPNFKAIVYDKLENIWIPFIRTSTSFDEDELERILTKAYKIVTKKEFDPLFQMGEIYTELNIILLT